jgi:hypothetical protein
VANIPAVIATVNAGRVAAGAYPLQDIPKGYRGKANSCPLAYAFKDALPESSVGTTTITFRNRARAAGFAAAIGGTVTDINGTATVRLPDVLKEFVADFDAGRLKQYDINWSGW